MSSPAESFLRAFHAAHPGATASSLGWGRLPSGQSSYEHLAEAVPRTGEAIAVLDLGCGNGHLLEAVRARAPRCRYVGVDIAEADLALARERWADCAAEFRHERAQTLSAATGSVDAVVSHLALMLMDDLDAVLAEVARALAPGGRFAATVGAGSASGQDDAFGLFIELYRELADRRRELRFGDARLYAEDTARDALEAAGFQDVAFDVQPLVLDGDPQQVWSSLALTYDVAFLAPQARAELGRRFVAGAERMADEAGVVPFALPLRRITARRA